MPVPIPSFTPWSPWSTLFAAPRPPEVASALLRAGCYLLARFDAEVPPGPARPDDGQVFYIGETHGDTTNLGQRLMQFGNSAGFFGEQGRGHYAAWGYPDLFPADVTGGPERRRTCTPDRVYVAVCAWPTGLPRETRGVFPTLVEQLAIWQHVEKNQQIPRLNNSGRVAPLQVPSLPAWPPVELDAALDPTRPEGERIRAAGALLDRIAVAADYSPDRTARRTSYGAWIGAERKAGHHHLYIGWYGTDPGGVTVSCYRGEIPVFGEHDGPVRTPDELALRLEALWITWWGGDPGDRT